MTRNRIENVIYLNKSTRRFIFLSFYYDITT